jgi:hypothetical protein
MQVNESNFGASPRTRNEVGPKMTIDFIEFRP